MPVCSQLLAFPGVIMQAFLIGAVGVHVFPYGWKWSESVLFGAILSATDPVAVVALLKELGVMPDLRVLIEAESFLNDGSAIVLFQLCVKILVDPSTYSPLPSPLLFGGRFLSRLRSCFCDSLMMTLCVGSFAPDDTKLSSCRVSDYVAFAFRLVFAAPALGLAMFLGMYFWLKATKDALEATTVTVAAVSQAPNQTEPCVPSCSCDRIGHRAINACPRAVP